MQHKAVKNSGGFYMSFDPINYIKPDNKIQEMINSSKPDKTIEAKQMSDRGISCIRGKYVIEPSTFISYANTRTASKENQQGIWFYNYHNNHYDCLTENEYKKIFFKLICEPSNSWWNLSMEKAYLPYFKNQLTYFKNNGTEEGFLQFNNGMLDFHQFPPKFKKASPKYFCHFRLPYDYDKNAKCPQFITFLNDIFEEDQERIKLVQEIMGASLYYCKCMQKLVVFLGDGSNGKSVLASVIKNMLGVNNVSSIALDQLSGNRFAKQNLDKKLLNISSEINPEKLYPSSDLKALTGGDSVEVEKKFQNSYTTEIHAKYILLANEMIHTADRSDGFYRRLIIIPFNQKYEPLVPGEEKVEGKKYQDIFLEDDLKTELPGIFNFAFNGLRRLIGNDYNFTESKACVKELEHYKNEYNIVKTFMNGAIDITDEKTDKIRSSTLFSQFEEFCKNNHYSRQAKQFTKKKFFLKFDQMINDMDNNTKKSKRSDGCYYIGMKYKK